MMKKNFFFVFLLIALKVSGQTSIPGQYAGQYVGQTVQTYGYIYKIDRDARTNTMIITFGSKCLLKGVILKLKSDQKLDVGVTFKDLPGRFITVTGKIIRDKGHVFIDGDDPSTQISVRQTTLAFN